MGSYLVTVEQTRTRPHFGEPKNRKNKLFPDISDKKYPRQLMPPVYEFSNPFFFSEEKMRMSQGSGSYTEIHKDGEAGIYFAVIMAFYIALVGALIGSNFYRAGCRYEQSATESRTIVECDGGENVTNRVIDDDEEDEREDVAMV